MLHIDTLNVPLVASYVLKSSLLVSQIRTLVFMSEHWLGVKNAQIAFKTTIMILAQIFHSAKASKIYPVHVSELSKDCSSDFTEK